MKKAKVITICGSLKFRKQMMEVAEQLELQRNCVLSVIYPTNQDKDAYTQEEVTILDEMHKQKIELSDAIFVVNINRYIGNSTKSEIEYAKKLGKEVIYLEKIGD